MVRADVSKVEECKQFVDETVNHFGRLDHLVNNAGVISGRFFEDYTKFTDVSSIMQQQNRKHSLNERGVAHHGRSSTTRFDLPPPPQVYGTHYAIPHLRKSRGKIVVMASTGASITMPRISFYNASKAALISFFETLRTEIGSNIGITIVTPGLIGSEMTRGPLIQEGNISWEPVESTERCAKAIVDSTCRGDMYLTVPSWMGWGFWTRVLCPEVLEWGLHAILVKWPHSQKKDL
nr:11-beta-hydroxysteroid dehydrogenase-like 3 [Quercus suber]